MAPYRSRRVRVCAGATEVEVVGTRFLVERLEARTHVVVDYGRVRVAWPSGQRELSDGKEGWFPEPAADSGQPRPARIPESGAARAHPEDSAADPGTSHPAAQEARCPAPAREVDWRRLAERGEFEQADAGASDPGCRPEQLAGEGAVRDRSLG